MDFDGRFIWQRDGVTQVLTTLSWTAPGYRMNIVLSVYNNRVLLVQEESTLYVPYTLSAVQSPRRLSRDLLYSGKEFAVHRVCR